MSRDAPQQDLGTKRTLQRAVRGFSSSLRHLATSLSENVAQLQRAADMPPNTSVREFKVVVQGLEEELSEVAQQVQHLQRFSMDSLSFEELLGHCTAVYNNNRSLASQLSQHLQQSGCISDQELQQPANPLQTASKGVRFDGRGDVMDDGDDMEEPMEEQRFASLRGRQQTPALPRHGSRLGNCDSDDEQEDDDGPQCLQVMQTKTAAPQGLTAPSTAKPTVSGMPASRAYGCRENIDPRHNGLALGAGNAWTLQSNSQLPSTVSKPWRPSLDSRAASTPDMFDVLSPSLLALQQKYGSGCSDGDAALGGGGLSSSSGPSPDDMDADPPGALAPPSAGSEQNLSMPGSLHAASIHPSPWSRASDASRSSMQSSGMPAPQQVAPTISAAERGSAGSGSAAHQASSRAHTPPEPLQAAGAGEDDTCALYQELIRSKGVHCSSRPQHQALARRTPPSGAVGEAAPAPAGEAQQQPQQPQQQQQHVGRSGSSVLASQAQGQAHPQGQAQAQAQHLSSTLDQLEALWVSSGQAALTPSRARGPNSDALQAVLTPSRSRRTHTPSRARVSHEYFTRQSAKAAAAAGVEGQAAGATGGQSISRGAVVMQSMPSLGVGADRAADFSAGFAHQQQLGQQGSPAFGANLTPPAATSSTASMPGPAKLGGALAAAASHGVQPQMPTDAGRRPGGRVLSPSTSQLLSKVYGTAGAAEQVRMPVHNTPAAHAASGISAHATPAAGQHTAAAAARSPSAQHMPQGVALPEAAYAALPAFCRSQLPFQQLEQGYRDLRQLVSGRCKAGDAAAEFSLEDLDRQGMPAARSKVFINCLIKLGCAELQRTAAGTFVYVLK